MNPRRTYLRARRWMVHNLLHLDDTPHRIALGVAIGMFIAVTPTPGLQTLLGIFICWLAGANAAASVPAVWFSNPVTFFPINWLNLGLGSLVVRGRWELWDEKKQAAFEALFPESQGLAELFSSMQHSAFWSASWALFAQFGLDLWVGSLIQGALLGLICYYPTRYAVVRYRAFKAQRKANKAARLDARKRLAEVTATQTKRVKAMFTKRSASTAASQPEASQHPPA